MGGCACCSLASGWEGGCLPWARLDLGCPPTLTGLAGLALPSEASYGRGWVQGSVRESPGNPRGAGVWGFCGGRVGAAGVTAREVLGTGGHRGPGALSQPVAIPSCHWESAVNLQGFPLF